MVTGGGNPVLAAAPDGTWLLYFTGLPQPWSRCPPQRSCATAAGVNATPTGAGHGCPGYAGRGDGIHLAHAKSLDGPWAIALGVAAAPADTTNPGPTVLPNGAALLAYKAAAPYGFGSELCPSARCSPIGVIAAPRWGAWPYKDQRFLAGESLDGHFIGGGACLEDPSNGYIAHLGGDLR